MSFAVGDRHVCGLLGEVSGSADAIRSRGARVLCFGDGQSGQLGTGSTESTRTVAPRPVVGLTDAVAVAAGIDRACALRANREVACWGALTGGRSSSLPVPIDGIDDAVAIALGGSARAMRLCAVRADGHVTCVGEEGEGAAVDVPGIDDAVEVAVALDAACARRRGGAVSCWGAATDGQLGHGSTQASASPVEVAGLTGVTRITAGEGEFCAVDARGRMACWGSNEHGQIGDGKSGGDADARTPIVVRGVSAVASVGLGGGTACAVGEDGRARCWGENAFGQAGRTGEGGDVLRPSEIRPRDAAVAAFGPYAAMDCGTNVCCGLHRDGHVSCQGSGSFFGSTEIRIAEPRAILGIAFLAPHGAESAVLATSR
jgi:alpha-tubulin suppressor-like RCC1 family protein